MLSNAQKPKALAAAAKNASFSSSSGLIATPQRADAVEDVQSASDESFSFPTVLELGHITRGAVKTRKAQGPFDTLDQNKENDSSDDNDSRVRKKLLEARCLRAARELGLEKRVANLRSFSDFGGIQNFSKELILCLSKAAETHEDRCSSFKIKLVPFCQTFDIDLDEALLQYLQSLCASTTASDSSIQEAASGKLCLPSKKCKVHPDKMPYKTPLEFCM
jgi:hypothetical protein